MSHPQGAGQIHIVAKKKSARVVVGARLLHVVDNYLRRKQRGRGDMSSLIYEALREVDLGSVQLITIQGQRKQVTARPTKIVLPTDVRDQLDRWSETRACSMNELLNSALVASLVKSKTEKSGERQAPARVEYRPRLPPLTSLTMPCFSS